MSPWGWYCSSQATACARVPGPVQQVGRVLGALEAGVALPQVPILVPSARLKDRPHQKVLTIVAFGVGAEVVGVGEAVSLPGCQLIATTWRGIGAGYSRPPGWACPRAGW